MRANILQKGGFSLIELLAVIVIMSILASIGLPLAEVAERRTKEESLRQALREIRSALDAYKQAVDQGRITREVGSSGYPPNLEALVSGVIDAQSPRGERIYFLRRIPKDPFVTTDAKSSIRNWGLRSYASPPDEPRPGKDVFDVYSLSTESGLNGIPYKQW